MVKFKKLTTMKEEQAIISENLTTTNIKKNIQKIKYENSR